ncbi:metal-sensitive transcriptional regulator [Candidatus Kaiserbacteria bacterium]|nr:metal-sensitive transcriptional regulator [Candidatus Kaiserbacteria bacterium]
MSLRKNIRPRPVSNGVGHAHSKSTEKIVRRLKILEGQVRGLQDMIKNDTYCVDVITQTSAVKQGLSNVEDMILENHLSTCVVDQIRSGDSKKAIGEVLKVYTLKRK